MFGAAYSSAAAGAAAHVHRARRGVTTPKLSSAARYPSISAARRALARLHEMKGYRDCGARVPSR